jgi:hypothetical protein
LRCVQSAETASKDDNTMRIAHTPLSWVQHALSKIRTNRF